MASVSPWPEVGPAPGYGDFRVTLDISELGVELEDRRLSSALGGGGGGGSSVLRIYSICHRYSTAEGCPQGRELLNKRSHAIHHRIYRGWP